MPKSLEQMVKEVAYAEGLLHGFDEAQQLLNKAFGGTMMFQMPENIIAWGRRADKMRGEVSALRNSMKLAKEQAD